MGVLATDSKEAEEVRLADALGVALRVEELRDEVDVDDIG